MLENFIYARKKELFTAELDAGNILDEAIVFIEDTKEIWNHGTYFDGSTPDLYGVLGRLFVFDMDMFDSSTGIVNVDAYEELIYAVENNWHVMVDLEGIVQEYNSEAWASPVTAIAQSDGNDIIMYIQPLGVYGNRIYNHTFKFTIFGANRLLQSEVLYETGKLVTLDINNFTTEDYVAALVSPVGTPVIIYDSSENSGIRQDGTQWQGIIASLYSTSQSSYTIRVYQHKSEDNGNVTIKVANATITSSGSIDITELGSHTLLINGDGTKYLSDDGTYKTIKTSELENDVPFVVDIVLPENGLYIYDINGNFTLPANWDTANNSKAVGVAILTDDCRFVVAKEDISTSTICWGGYGTDISTLTNYTSDTDAATDFDGVNNTTKIIAAIGNTNDGYRDGTAAGDCAAYTFPNGKTGYLGAAGEWQVARQNKEDLNSALTLIGGTTMKENAYWTSTEYSSYYAWRQCFDSRSSLGYYGKGSYGGYVRAFLDIEGTGIQNRVTNLETRVTNLEDGYFKWSILREQATKLAMYTKNEDGSVKNYYLFYADTEITGVDKFYFCTTSDNTPVIEGCTEPGVGSDLIIIQDLPTSELNISYDVILGFSSMPTSSIGYNIEEDGIDITSYNNGAALFGSEAAEITITYGDFNNIVITTNGYSANEGGC